jgi:hypothetical protein
MYSPKIQLLKYTGRDYLEMLLIRVKVPGLEFKGRPAETNPCFYYRIGRERNNALLSPDRDLSDPVIIPVGDI